MTNINNRDFEFSKNPSGEDEDKTIKRVIKTYKDVAVNALDDNPTSLAKMIIQEKKKQEKQEKRSLKNPKNMTLVVLSTILSILGIISIAGVIIFITTKQQDTREKNTLSQLVSSNHYDYKKVVEYSPGDIDDLMDDLIKNSTIPIDSVKNLFFTKKDKDGYSYQIGAKEFLIGLDTRVSNQFIRNLKSQFSIGIINIVENKPYLILETINGDASTTDLLTWEKQLLFDIGSIFDVNQKYYSYKYKNINFYNQTVRVILNDEGSLVFGYSLITGNKIIFFTDMRTFKIILNQETNIEKQ